MEIPPAGVRKGMWSKEEDDLLRACIQRYGEGKWRLVPQRAGLNRCRKSCRLRWMNYLKPDIKRGNFTEDEADMIMRFHRLLGNRWSLIAARFPGRTSNDVKNYWNTHILKRLQCSSSSSQEATLKTQKLIRPRPLSFSRKRKGLLLADKSDCRDKPVIATDSDSGDVAVAVGADSSAKESEKEEWWQSLLDDVIVNKGSNEEDSLWRLGGEEHQDKFLQPQFWDDHDDQQQFHFFQ